MKERTVKREVKTTVHVAETNNHVVEILENERGELRIRRRRLADDPATDRFAWKYSTGNGEWKSDSYWGSALANRADGWSPEFEG